MNNIKISIIIASRNAREDLKKCLSSIFDNCSEEAIEVIVSDNNSNDGSVGMLAKYFPQVKVCGSEHDISYPLTVNRGINWPIAAVRKPTIRIEEVKLRTRKIQDTVREKIVQEL